MKKMLLLLTLFLSFISAYAAENLIMNGNFSERDDDWKGDVSIKKLDGNLCLQIKLKNRDRRFFAQYSNWSEVVPTSYLLRFKYKTSSDYSGDGVKIMLLVYQAGGSAYRTSAKQAKKSFTLEPTEEWVTLNWDITFEGDMLRGVKRMLRFDISPGDGKIYFDDIELVGIPED